MTFLPIVDRELRVAARRRSTYRIRTWTVVIALVLGAFSLIPITMMGMAGAYSGPGKSLYQGLTDFVFWVCLLAGVLLTADCLSAEKREGTLGLLFLTDLKGYDVVLGKFVAMSLNAVYGLLALLPVTGLCLLLGGLTAGEYWRMNLALLNTLFFSLATGICVSALGRESHRVMVGTLGLVVLLAGCSQTLAKVGALIGISSSGSDLILSLGSCFAWVSPYSPFASALGPAFSQEQGKYWGTLLASQLFAWLLLALAAAVLPHRWQERAAGVRLGQGLTRWVRRPGGHAGRAKARQKLLPINPIFWLVSTQLDLRPIAWAIVAVWGVVVFSLTLFLPAEAHTLMTRGNTSQPFRFVLESLLALQACRFFAEARRNGSLELLLSTPLTGRNIIDGQALALRRNFLWPIVAFLALQFVPSIVFLIAERAWHFPPSSRNAGVATFELMLPTFYCLRTYADCYALGWFGLWLALTMKRPALSPALAILLVLILPSVLLCGINIFTDIIFIIWGVIGVHRQDLRSRIARQYERALGPGKLPLRRFTPQTA